MRQFKHYILTRFNVGLYKKESKIRMSTDLWMEHRMKLFTAFTLPSIMNQSCQNFTWLIAMDDCTPRKYVQMLEDIRYPNMQFCAPDFRQIIEHSDYDLITTRIDNDDAFAPDVVKNIQKNWNERRPKPLLLVFTYGFILNLATKQMLFMEYRLNNCPTLIEDARQCQTAYRWKHTAIPMEVQKQYIDDQPYWLQVIHSQNLMNRFPRGSEAQIIRKDVSERLDYLNYFGIDSANLPLL